MPLSPNTGARTRGDVLITGATGFLGMELMARLLEHGDRRVWALVRAPDEAGAAERLHSTPLLARPGSGPRPRSLDRLLEFAVRANWGRTPVGRVEATGAPRLVSEPALT
jgi:nucleoside-diphosphate-sugar epimerase